MLFPKTVDLTSVFFNHTQSVYKCPVNNNFTKRRVVFYDTL